MITEHDIEYMTIDINSLTAVDALRMRQLLLQLQQAIEDKLNSKLVHLTIKPRSSGDYVYANWTDGRGSHVEYIGKWIPSAEIDAMLAGMKVPSEADFRVSDKKAKRLSKTQWIATYEGGEGINGNVEFKYNYDGYRMARERYMERRDILNNPLAKIAQTDRKAGILKLEGLQEKGFYIKPL